MTWLLAGIMALCGCAFLFLSYVCSRPARPKADVISIETALKRGRE